MAGLTELMLNSATRRGGIAVRLSQSFHSRDSARWLAPASMVLPKQVDRALVEAEVVDRPDDLAVLDEVDPVSRQTP